jgi:hypothetical protein
MVMTGQQQQMMIGQQVGDWSIVCMHVETLLAFAAATATANDVSATAATTSNDPTATTNAIATTTNAECAIQHCQCAQHDEHDADDEFDYEYSRSKEIY